MKRTARSHRRVLLLAGALLALAGIAWGAASRPHAGATPTAAVARSVSAPAVKPATVHSQTAAVVPAPRVARSRSSVAPTPVAGEAGMRIFKDPETGEIGPPTAENAAILARDAQPEVDVRNLPQIPLPNGGYELLIDGKIEDAMIMQIDAKGNRVVRCVNDPKAALKQVPQAPAREDR
jgi:hypothetical protein